MSLLQSISLGRASLIGPLSEQSCYRAGFTACATCSDVSVLLILRAYMCVRSETNKKNVATSVVFSYVIGCYSVSIPSQPCLANIEIAEDVLGSPN